MHRTLPDDQPLRLFSCAALLLISAIAYADDYRAARAELVAAYEAENYVAMRAAAQKSLAARPGYAGALFNLALAEALIGDAGASLQVLQQLLAKKIDFGADEIDEFAALQELPEWDSYVASVQALYEPVGLATVAYTFATGDFIPEGIAAGSDGELYLGSIRHGDIVRIGDSTTHLLGADDGAHWSVFGMRIDGSGRLWFVSSAIDEFADLKPDDAGKNGLYAVDTDTGKVLIRALLPRTGNKQVLGDLIIAGDDTIYLADQADGIVYRYAMSTGEFTTLVDRGMLGSPQGLVLDATGDYLYVADYIGGLYRVTLASRQVEPVTAIDTASTYGIDGLYRYGNKLIAIQNGIRPNRVVEFELSTNGSSIVSSRILAMNLPEFDEPNLGVIRDDELLFIANSHWNRFDRDGNLPEDLAGPIVLRVNLRGQ